MWGPSSTVLAAAAASRVSSSPRLFVPEFVPDLAAATAEAEAESARDDSVLYKGTAKAKTDPCFGSTVFKKTRRGKGVVSGFRETHTEKGDAAHLSIYLSASRP
jgi:hypothetical protein